MGRKKKVSQASSKSTETCTRPARRDQDADNDGHQEILKDHLDQERRRALRQCDTQEPHKTNILGGHQGILEDHESEAQLSDHDAQDFHENGEKGSLLNDQKEQHVIQESQVEVNVQTKPEFHGTGTKSMEDQDDDELRNHQEILEGDQEREVQQYDTQVCSRHNVQIQTSPQISVPKQVGLFMLMIAMIIILGVVFYVAIESLLLESVHTSADHNEKIESFCNRTVATANQNYDASQVKLDDCRRDLQNSTDKAHFATQEHNTCKAQLVILNDTQRQKEEEIRSITQKYDTCLRDLTTCQTDKRHGKKTLDTVTQQLSGCQKELDVCNANEKQNREKLRSTNDEHNTCKAQLEVLDEKYKNEQKLSASLRKELEEKNSEFHSVRNDLHQFEGLSKIVGVACLVFLSVLFIKSCRC